MIYKLPSHVVAFLQLANKVIYWWFYKGLAYSKGHCDLFAIFYN